MNWTILILLCFGTVIINAQVIQPSIMIVPQKKQTEKYVDLIENDRFLRVAIAKIDEFFLERSFPTVDFIQHMETVSEDMIMENQNQKSLEQQLAEQTNADVIVYFDAEYSKSGGDKYVDIYLKAIDRQTAQVLASTTQTSNLGTFDDGAAYLKNAIDKCADNFLDNLNRSFSRIRSKGKATKLSITFSEDSDIDLFHEVNHEYDLLSDILDEYLILHTVNNYARCPIKVRTKYECDDLRLVHTVDDKPFTTNDFYRSLRKYLRSKYKIKCEGSVIGSSIRFTITGLVKN